MATRLLERGGAVEKPDDRIPQSYSLAIYRALRRAEGKDSDSMIVHGGRRLVRPSLGNVAPMRD